MVFYGKQPIRSKILMNDQPIEQVQSFMFLGCKLRSHNLIICVGQ